MAESITEADADYPRYIALVAAHDPCCNTEKPPLMQQQPSEHPENLVQCFIRDLAEAVAARKCTSTLGNEAHGMPSLCTPVFKGNVSLLVNRKVGILRDTPLFSRALQ